MAIPTSFGHNSILDQLETEINRGIKGCSDFVSGGIASDYATYQHECGRIRAMRDVLEILDKLRNPDGNPN